MNGPRQSVTTALGALLVAVASILTSVVEAATVRRGPYLQMGTQDRIIVRWRTDVATDSRVSYGLCFGGDNCLIWEKVDATLTTEHEILLDGLAPNTRYYYAIGTTTEILAGNDDSHHFVTSVPAGISKRTRVWVLGDSGTGNVNAQAVRDAYDTYAGGSHTDLWLMLGDNAYNRGTDAEYQTAVFNTYPEMLRKSVLWPSFGNHDGASAEASTQTGPYFDIFSLPRSAEAGGVPSGTEAYYSYDYANIHFVVLDSFGSDRSPPGAMLTWLRADLEATRQDWIVAYWHHPPYSKGSHNSNTETALKQMRQNALPILENYGVDLVLAGHSHAYERSFLLDGHYGLSSTLTPSMILNTGSGDPNGSGPYVKPARGTDPHKGTVYVVAGSSGKVSSEGALDHPAMFVSLESLGSLVLTVDGNRLDAAFLRPTGTVGDAFTILKGSPSNIEVTPNDHGYDSVAVELDAVQTFQIRNRSTLELEVIPSLVGDDIAEFSIIQGESPFTIQAGETRTLDVRFAPTSYGAKSALLRLTTNEPEQSPVDVSLSGIGVTAPDIDATLTALDFGEVLVGATSAQTFTITNVGTADLQVSAITPVDGDAGEFVLAQGGTPFIVAPDATHSIEVHFAPATGGPKATTLRLTSDDPDESPLDLALSGTALTAPEIDVVPSTHDFGVLWVGREAFAVFALRNVGSADLQVVAAGLVGGDAGDFGITEGAAPFTIAPGATHNLVVRFAPASAGGKNITLRLSSDDEDESVLDLAAGGTGILPPDIDVLVAPDLGNVVIGTTALGTVVLRNLGGAELQVSASSLIPGQAEEFAITQGGAPFVVASGQAHSLEVRFAPTSRGPGAATLRLESDDPDESTVDVTIVGTGLLPADIDLGPPPQYGDVVVGTTATRSLVIQNLGDVELQVAANLVDGASSEFAIPQGSAPFTVMPGASHNLDIHFIPSSGGSKIATVRLTSDDQDETTLDVILVGTGLMPPDIDLVPTPPDYGQLLVGTSVPKTFVIRNLGDVELQVTSSLVGGEAGQFALVQGQTPFTVPPGATFNLDVTFAPTSGGSKTTTLRLTSNDADENTIDVDLSGIGLMPADIDLPTTSHQYGNVVVGATSAAPFVIRNLGDVSLQVTAASVAGGEAGEFTIEQGATPFTVTPGGTHTLEVRFAPASGGVKSTTLRLTSDDADETILDVALSGMGLMPPDIDLNTTPHNYGPIVVGTTASHMLVVRNLGDVDLHIHAISLVGAQASEFTISQGAGAVTVGRGTTHTVTVSFVPSSGGPKAATLRLTSDDADEGSLDIAVNGLGLMPADIELVTTAHNYGPVVVGNTATGTFVVRNLGDVSLHITAMNVVTGSASEFAVSQGAAPFTIAPGSTHNVDVRFGPASGGVKTAVLRLTSDDADEATVDIALNGTGLMPADIHLAETSHDYGQVVVGTGAVRTLVITNVGDVDLQVTAIDVVDGGAAGFAVSQGNAPFVVGPGATHSVDVRFAPTSAGDKTARFRLSSNDQDEATVDVVVTGRGLMPPDIDLAPVAHDYGQTVVGNTATRTFVVRNLGDVDLHVTSAGLIGGASTEFVIAGPAAFTVGPGATYNLELRFVPVSGGPKSTTLRLTSDDPDEIAFDVTISGIGMMPPDIDVGPMPSDFGDVLVGTTASRTFVIRNLGDIPLQVTGTVLVGSNAGEFSVTQGGAPFTVAPGASHDLAVRFAPTSGGPKSVTLRLTSDDSDESAVDVVLSGTATTAPEIVVVLSPIHHGETLVGTTSSRTFAIENVGSADLHATAALSGGNASEFALAPGSTFNISPGGTHTINVTFTPLSGGTKSTTLRLTSDDTDEGSIDVILDGVGMMPADIDVAPTAHNYSDVLLGTTALKTLAIRNLGDVSLHVTAAAIIDDETSDFTVVQGGAPFDVAPGATHNLDIRFAPTSPGPKDARLRVTSDDQDENVVDVALSGTATTAPELDVVTASQNYGVVWVGANASRMLVIRNVGSADLHVTSTSLVGDAAGEFALVQGSAPFTVPVGAMHQLDIRFAPTSPGAKSATLRIVSDDQDEGTVDLSVGGAGIMPPDMDVTPLQHDYGEVVISMPRSRTVSIRNLGGADLRVTADSLIGANADEFAIAAGGAPFTVVAGATHNIEIRLAPTSEGAKMAALRLVSDDPDEGTVDVQLNGTATVLVPDIAALPISHDFGSQAVGTATTQGFVVSNTGTKNLVLGAPTLSGPEADAFAVSSGQGGTTIAPGTTRLIQIRFSPATAGPKTAALTIPSDDPDENPLVIPLRGTTPPTFVEASEGGSANITTVTTATTLTGATGHLYLAAVSTKPYRQVSTMSGLGLTWMRVASQCAGRSQTGIELWWAQGPATSGQVTASLVSAPNSAVIAVARYAGTATTNPLAPLVTGNTNGVNGSCGTATDTATYLFNVTPSVNNSVVVGAVALRNKTHSSGSGYATRIEVSHGTAGNVAGLAFVDRVIPLATTTPLNGTLNSPVDWAIIGTEIRSEP